MDTCTVGKQTKYHTGLPKNTLRQIIYRVDNINMHKKGGRDRGRQGERKGGRGNLGFFLHLGNFTILYFIGEKVGRQGERKGGREGEEI